MGLLQLCTFHKSCSLCSYSIIFLTEKNSVPWFRSTSDAIPSVQFHVDHDTIIVYNNEVGFQEKNIRAICDVGRTTKGKHKFGYIGQSQIISLFLPWILFCFSHVFFYSPSWIFFNLLTYSADKCWKFLGLWKTINFLNLRFWFLVFWCEDKMQAWWSLSASCRAVQDEHTLNLANQKCNCRNGRCINSDEVIVLVINDVGETIGMNGLYNRWVFFLGQKGIGFKSVFRITDLPEIHSNGYHIRFDANSKPLGYILPQWVNKDDRVIELPEE